MKNIIYLLVLLSITLVKAAGFNCSLVKTTIEQTICSNPEISKEDESLTKLYNKIKDSYRYPKELVRNQQAWLKERNSCKTDSCILEKYNSRKVELNAWLEESNEKISKLENCTDLPECWPEGSAMNIGLSMLARLEKASAQLKIRYNELTVLLSESPDYSGEKQPDSRTISILTRLHSSWDRYSYDECELVGTLTGAGGSWQSTYATRCIANLTEERLYRVSSAIKCIQKIPLKDRWTEQARCLQQLAPLVNKL